MALSQRFLDQPTDSHQRVTERQFALLIVRGTKFPEGEELHCPRWTKR